MKRFLLVVGGTAGAAVAVLFAYRDWLTHLYAGMRPEQVADVQINNMLTLFAGAGLVLVVMTLVLLIRSTTSVRIPDREPHGYDYIDTSWREVLDYRPPVPQLPARVVNVPRYTNMGTAQPWGGQVARQTELRTLAESGDELTVPLDKLVRFLSLATPARNEWHGDKDLYTQCLNFSREHGLLVKRGNGYAWHEAYPIPARQAWVAQFEDQRWLGQTDRQTDGPGK